MPKIVIWIPRNKKEVGHVAIATNAYYVSFWPARCLIKDGKHIGSISDAAVFVLDVHKGRLVFNQDFEKIDEDDPNKEYEDDCDLIEYQIDAAKVSNEDLNAEIEKFLRYNGIDPEDVTLARGEEKYREFKQLAASLPQEEAKRIEDDRKPVKSLTKTKYSIVTELVSSSKDNDSASFYNSQQSCVSFAFNLVQMAWLKSHPDRPIPVVNYKEAKNPKEISMSYYASTVGASSLLTGKIPKEFAYKVSWFEKEVVQKYLITVKVNNQPIIPAQLEIEKGLRQVKPTLVIYFVLLLLGYFFPDTAYPNVLIYWNYVASEDQVIADDPSILRYFIVPVFVILFAHNWCGVVLSVVIFQLGDISYAIMESYSGEFWGSHLLVESLSAVIRVFDDVREHCKRIGREPENLGLSGLVRILIDSRRAHL